MRRRRPKTLPMGGTQVHIIGIPGDGRSGRADLKQIRLNDGLLTVTGLSHPSQAIDFSNKRCFAVIITPDDVVQFLELKAVLRRNSFSYNAPFEIEYTFQY